MGGVEFALNNLGLAIFTTVAPAGVAAFILVALLLMAGRLSPAEREGLEHHMVIPLALATAGLVAAASHLGTPANALYVFIGVGRSGLSNEVLAAVLFLGTAGAWWLASFSNLRNHHALWGVWLVVTCMLGVVLLAGMAFAYRMGTVPTWDTPLVPINVWLTGLAAGCPVALLTSLASHVGVPSLATGRQRARCASWERGLIAVSAALTALACASMLVQNAQLAQMSGSWGTAASFAPHYGIAIALYALASIAGLGLVGAAIRRPRKQALGLAVGGVALVFLGLFCVRFQFYCLHMTAGL